MDNELNSTQEYGKLLTLIGCVCTQYSFLDYLVSNVVWSLLRVEKDAGMIITGAMDIRPKIAVAIQLSEHYDKHGDIRTELRNIERNASKDTGFIPKRNLIIHGIFSSRDGDPTVMVEAHRKKSARTRATLTIEFVQETHDEIVSTSKRLVRLLERAEINVD